MEKEVKAKLDNIFGKHEAARKIVSEEQKVRETDAGAFLNQFLQARESIFRPAMQGIGEYVKGRDYHYEIDTKEDGPDPSDATKTLQASITIVFFLSHEPRRHPNSEYPHLTVVCNKEKAKVWFHESTSSPGRGGAGSRNGQAALDDVTSEMLQERMADFLLRVLSNPS